MTDRHRTADTRRFAPWNNPDARPLLRFEAVSKQFGSVPAVNGVTLDIYEGEFFALLGPSGCGKTTLMRMVAGFERPSAGRILLDGQDIADVPPHRRPTNMMFQSYALFPHMTVAGNVAFGLRQEGHPKAEIERRVADALALVRLETFEDRKPHQLSGGQRQRVALARALVKRPRVLLLDEPMSALDRKLREETRFELMDLQTDLGLTFIIVTHDQDEAMMLADRIAVMDRGELVQVAPPAEVYERPNSRWVADFIGDVNLLEGRLAGKGPAGTEIKLDAGGRVRAAQPIEAEAGTKLWVALRPEKIRIEATPQAQEENRFAGTVVDIGYLGDVSVYRVKLENGVTMKAMQPNSTLLVERPIRVNDAVWLGFAADAAVVLTR